MADINPLRYRGYYYDAETGFYYLQSRYYDPQVGRFICADEFASTGQGILGTNMFAYCNNNPVNIVDPSGSWGISSIFVAVAAVAVVVAVAATVVVAAAPVLATTTGLLISSVNVTAAASVGYAALNVAAVSATAARAVEVLEYSEHKKGARKSTENKHQKGQTRKQRDAGNEKGDVRRKPNPNKHRGNRIFLIYKEEEQ